MNLGVQVLCGIQCVYAYIVPWTLYNRNKHGKIRECDWHLEMVKRSRVQRVTGYVDPL